MDFNYATTRDQEQAAIDIAQRYVNYGNNPALATLDTVNLFLQMERTSKMVSDHERHQAIIALPGPTLIAIRAL